MEDEKIIELYWNRDEAAISQTAQKYGGMVRSIAYRILHNVPDSEECENDTYHTVWNKIPPAKPPYFTAFLGRIARNIAFDKYDYNHAAKRNSDLDTALSELAHCLPARANTEEELEQWEMAKHISQFLRSVNFWKRVVFIRRYWYCESILEIAKEFKFSESKVKSMLLRTRKELKQYLEKQGVTI